MDPSLGASHLRNALLLPSHVLSLQSPALYLQSPALSFLLLVSLCLSFRGLFASPPLLQATEALVRVEVLLLLNIADDGGILRALADAEGVLSGLGALGALVAGFAVLLPAGRADGGEVCLEAHDGFWMGEESEIDVEGVPRLRAGRV